MLRFIASVVALGFVLSLVASLLLLDWLNAVAVGFFVPFWLHVVIGGTTVLLTRILWSTFSTPGRAWHVVSACTFLCVVCIYGIAWNSRKPFLQDLFSIRAGMTASEVDAVMKGYIRGTGWPTPPYGRYAEDNLGQLAIPKAVVYRHSALAAYNADWGIVTFSSGRVVRVEFSAD